MLKWHGRDTRGRVKGRAKKTFATRLHLIKAQRTGDSKTAPLTRFLDNRIYRVLIPPCCKWIRKVNRKWIYPYPDPVVITNGVD